MSGTTDASSSTSVIYSIPVQFKIEDDSCEYVRKMKEIMEKDLRNPDDKEQFMINLKEGIKDSSIIKDDRNTDTINLSNFKLTEFRCYKEENNPENYRFKSYYDKFKVGVRLINGELKHNECGFYGCLKKHRSTDGHINNPNTFYLSFAYNYKQSSTILDNI